MSDWYNGGQKSNKRVFISFSMADVHFKKVLQSQAKSDRFNLEWTDYSLNVPFDNAWKTNCEAKLRQVSVVICLIGEDTWKKEGVIWELNKAYQLGKPVFGVKIYRDRSVTIPQALREHNAKITSWNMDEITRTLESL